MVRKKVEAKPTLDDVAAYITTVDETFHGKPEKYREFLNLLDDLLARRVDQAHLHTRGIQLFKDHLNLVVGLNGFLPAKQQIFIPPEPELPDNIEIKRDDADAMFNKIKVNLDNRVHDASSYITAVQEAFHCDPAKCKDFLNLFGDLSAKGVDQASLNARVGELFKDHPNLISGLNDFLPAEAKIIILPEPEKPTELPDNIEIKHKDAEDLLNKIKTRFQKLDTHIPSSFVKVMEDFKEGKKSEEELREEVLDLLYYHEDLRAEFLKLLQ